MSDNPVSVDNIARQAAMTAYMLEVPHPKGYIWSSPMHRLGRAIYAYEWAKANKREASNMPGYFIIPSPDEVEAVILEKETNEE